MFYGSKDPTNSVNSYLEADRPRFEPATFWVASERSTVTQRSHTYLSARPKCGCPQTKDENKVSTGFPILHTVPYVAPQPGDRTLTIDYCHVPVFFKYLADDGEWLKVIYDPMCIPCVEFRELSEDLIRTRVNRYKLIQHHCHYDLRKFNFTNRVIPIWNSLSDHVVSAETVRP